MDNQNGKPILLNLYYRTLTKNRHMKG